MKPSFLPVCAMNSVFLCISKYHVCNLPRCVLFLAHVTGVHLLCSDTIQSVVSLGGDPSKHLERCCDPLIRVLQNSNSQQMTTKVFLLVETTVFVVSHIPVFLNKHAFSKGTVCSPPLLQGTEGFPESRADLAQQLDK